MVDVATVKIWGAVVGAIRWDDEQQLGFFQFAKSFLSKGWDVAPIKMPLAFGDRIISFPELRAPRGQSEDTFKGLPGLLADALPDRYGNQLMNVWLTKNGRPENSMNPVEKLCFMGTRGMGALEFEPAQPKGAKQSQLLELETLVDVAKRMLDERSSFLTSMSEDEEKAMLDVLKIGTSAGGARPKAVIAFHPQTKEIRSGQAAIPKGFEHWLIKLDGVSGVQFGDSAGWGRVEYAYYLMAKAAGITISKCELLEENNRAHFLTKRFDRDGNIKHHLQTWCGIQHFDYNNMNSFSYEQLFQTMRLLRLTYPEAEEMFRRMVFNVIATNYDDHTKNFSFLLKKDQKWELAPAYDLCFSFDPTNHWVSQQTLSINGKRLGITKEDVLTIANANSIRNPDDIIHEVNTAVKNWTTFATEAGVSIHLKNKIAAHLNTF
ncbi:MAG: type II toxin-antitoxin system HipA family toxin [Schleiferiaceae bacterium]|nr:type II toxin-antitoxin system HipA family toxin [Schleiferiaceae bacterium]